jgi:uncharacterized protein
MSGMAEARPWRTFSAYLRERFGCRVRKITVDGGFTCPNRDGTRGSGGCIYCNNEAFSPAVSGLGTGRPAAPLPIRAQVEAAIARGGRRTPAKFMVYFQAFTNTYAPVARLRERYDEALVHPDIVALAIGTRPDCIDDAVLDLLSSYAPRHEVWLELGLQTIHDETLARINRGHTARAFLDAVNRARARPLKICVHVILGLPGETREHNRATADALARLPYHGLKIHPLAVVKGTILAEKYARGEVALLSEEAFVERAADFLERTPPDAVVQRLTADTLSSLLVAPAWCANKQRLLDRIAGELERRGTRQGSAARGPAAPI